MKRYDLETQTIAPDGRPLEDQPKWRRDFPVDWPEDAYVSRRDFTKFLVLTSFAFATGQFWIAAQAGLARRAGAPEPLQIARADAVPVGGAKPFSFPGLNDPCLLVRVDATSFVAFSQSCTHLSCAVVPEPDKNRLFCPCHEGAFDLTTGRPIEGPPRRPLPQIAIEVRDGIVWATGTEERTT